MSTCRLHIRGRTVVEDTALSWEPPIGRRVTLIGPFAGAVQPEHVTQVVSAVGLLCEVPLRSFLAKSFF